MGERIKVYAAYVIVIGGVAALLYFFVRYALGVMLPFLIGWAAALLVRRPARFLHRRLRIKEGALRLLLATGGVAVLGFLSVLGIRALVRELSGLLESWGGEGEPFSLSVLALIPEGWRDRLSPLLERFSEALLGGLPGFISRLATLLPSLLLSVAVGAIAAVYFCLDLDRVHAAVLRLLPKRWHSGVKSAKKSALDAALAVIKANLTLMLIAFFIMLVGFMILRLPYPLLLSGVLALFDFLPVVGAGTLLLPWGIALLLLGRVSEGVGILVIFAVVAVVKQLAEPHLLGRGYGMHPLLTLLSMYAGARLLGAFGIILAPMAALLLYGILVTPVEKKKGTPEADGSA